MDIVERLRKNCTCSEVGSTPCKCEEECENAFDGADEIERLREALRQIVDFDLYGDYSNAYEISKIARSALMEKK